MKGENENLIESCLKGLRNLLIILISLVTID